ncbi:hypothetical protein BTVI_71221 [Pitangus sulphuratus]|nr:hypothetical protein BTVI_71221 [Pitangus sulphuratus]
MGKALSSPGHECQERGDAQATTTNNNRHLDTQHKHGMGKEEIQDRKYALHKTHSLTPQQNSTITIPRYALKAQPQLALNAANGISGAIRREKMSLKKADIVEAARAEPTEE